MKSPTCLSSQDIASSRPAASRPVSSTQHPASMIWCIRKLLATLLIACSSVLAVDIHSTVIGIGEAPYGRTKPRVSHDTDLQPTGLFKRQRPRKYLFVPIGPVSVGQEELGVPSCGLWAGGWASGTAGDFFFADPQTRRFRRIPKVALEVKGVLRGELVSMPRAEQIMESVMLQPWVDQPGMEMRPWCTHAAEKLIKAWREQGVAKASSFAKTAIILGATSAVTGGIVGAIKYKDFRRWQRRRELNRHRVGSAATEIEMTCAGATAAAAA